MEWYGPNQEEISIVAEPLDQLDGNGRLEEQMVLNITEPPPDEQQGISTRYLNPRQEYGSKDRFALLATGSDSGQPMQFIHERRRKKLWKKKRSGKHFTGSEKRSKFKKDADEVYPVKIASRKILNKKHFDKYVGNETLDSLPVKVELDETSECVPDAYIEMCQLQDDAECSSIKLEYGSGVSIYERVEAAESDDEIKDRASPILGFNSEYASVKCTKCSVKFTSKTDMLKHRTEVHKSRHIRSDKKKKPVGFKCKECGAVYKRAYKYQCHMGGHDGRFTCDQCHRTFVRVTGFRKHLRQCHKVSNPNVCVVCGQYFLSQNTLDEHLQEKHPEDAEKLRAYFKQCAHCRYQFITELSYLNHQKNAPYHCHSCNMTFECNNKLGFHLNFKHKPQDCNQCGKKFEAFDQYTYHVRYYHTDKHIKCPYCDEHFRVRSRLLIHIDVNHTDGHNYKCNQCEYTAKNYASVNRHRRISHMPKSETHKNVCSICGKSFLVQSRLKVHMKSHSAEKPHVCQMCGRGYKFEYLLKRHQKNPDLCLRVLFPNGSRLERKGKRRCDMCNLGFESPDQLALHMVEKHNVKIETKEPNVPQTQVTYDQTDFDKSYSVVVAQDQPEHLESRSNPVQYSNILSNFIIPDDCGNLSQFAHFTSFANNGSGSSKDDSISKGGREMSAGSSSIDPLDMDGNSESRHHPLIVDYVNSEPVTIVDANQLISVKEVPNSVLGDAAMVTLEPGTW